MNSGDCIFNGSIEIRFDRTNAVFREIAKREKDINKVLEPG